MYCDLVGAIITIGVNFLLIPHFGYVGAAITSLVTWTVEFVVIIIISRRFFVWPFPFGSLVKIIFASAVMTGGVYVIANFLNKSNLFNLIVEICTGTIIYIIMLLLLQELKPEEIKEIKNWRGKVRGHL